MFGGLGMGELIVIFLVVLLLFGAKRLPEIGSSLGKGIREFKGSISRIEREIQVPEKPKSQVSPGADTGVKDEEEEEDCSSCRWCNRFLTRFVRSVRHWKDREIDQPGTGFSSRWYGGRVSGRGPG